MLLWNTSVSPCGTVLLCDSTRIGLGMPLFLVKWIACRSSSDHSCFQVKLTLLKWETTVCGWWANIQSVRSCDSFRLKWDLELLDSELYPKPNFSSLGLTHPQLNHCEDGGKARSAFPWPSAKPLPLTKNGSLINNTCPSPTSAECCEDELMSVKPLELLKIMHNVNTCHYYACYCA